jgi:hypothetical protein
MPGAHGHPRGQGLTAPGPARAHARVPARALALSLALVLTAMLGLHRASPAEAASAAAAGTYEPAADDSIVARQPVRLSRASRLQQAQLQQRPGDVELAAQQAREALRLARELGDERELGRAQAVLAPWWDSAAPPPAMRLLRASLLQSLHRFDDARRDLDVLLASEGSLAARTPTDQQQALLSRAALHQLQGRLGPAESDCRRLLAASAVGSAAQRLASACLAELDSLRGGAAGAQRAALALQGLQAALPRSSSERTWLALMQAELAVRRGEAGQAQHNFEQALAGGPEVYALTALCDWMLARGQEAKALALASRAPWAASDALAVRRVLALARSQPADARTLAESLLQSLAQDVQRGGPSHEREQALLRLHVLGQPQQAWPLAQANWRQQQEPLDALLYVQAAVAAGRGNAARALVQRLQGQGWHDVRLQAALQPSRHWTCNGGVERCIQRRLRRVEQG